MANGSLILLRTYDKLCNIREARKIANCESKTGRLPDHPLLDEHIIHKKNPVRQVIQPAGIIPCDDWLVYPSSAYFNAGISFQKGKDLVDIHHLARLPSEYIPEDIAEDNWAALRIIPRGFDGGVDRGVILEGGMITLHPERIEIINMSIQLNGCPGKTEHSSRIPSMLREWDPDEPEPDYKEKWKALPWQEKRWLRRVQNQGVRPLCRRIGDSHISRTIYAVYKPDHGFGVVGVQK